MSRFIRVSRYRHLVLAATAGGLFLVAPGVLSPYALITLCYALVLAIACLGFNLLFGTTGLLSLGHAAFFGVGAYTGAFLYRFFGLESFELYLLSGVVASTLFAAVIGFPCLPSSAGITLRAIRDNEARAAHIGIPVRRYRWYAFILSGAFMGLAGALHGQLNRQITPQQLDWLFSAEIVLATVLGGSRDFIGPVLGAFIFSGLEEISERWPWGRSALMGSLLILVVFLFPQGLAGAARRGIDTISRLKR